MASNASTLMSSAKCEVSATYIRICLSPRSARLADPR
jgi:hypothetical protein